MTEFLYFLGRFHVLVLHLPIGILLLAVLLEVLTRTPRFQSLQPSVSLVWLVGAISGLVTIGLGYLHVTEGGFSGPSLNLHRWSATLLTFFAFVAWAWRSEAKLNYDRFWWVPATATVILLFSTGHYGGNLTHGDTYLVEFAPGPIRTLAGLPPEMLPRPAVTNVVEADIYLDVVAPALRRRCVNCHNDNKRRGDLSLARYDEILQGGESGPALVAGDPEHSEIVRRVRLPENHFDYMPKNGKTPLTPEEIDAITWWIAQDAPAQGSLATLNAPGKIKQSVSDILELN